MGSQRLRPLPWGMTAKACWVLPNGTLTGHDEAAKSAPWRPWLEISWRKGKTLTLVMMNPSAATPTYLDATVRNALYQALRLDIDGEPVGRLIVVNAFDVRATTLDVAAGRAEVQLELEGERVTLGEGLPLVSEHCDRYIAAAAQEADLIVCGWGAKVGLDRAEALLSGPLQGADLHAWRLSPSGFPKHPRGQGQDLLPCRWVDGALQPPPEEGGLGPALRLRPKAKRPSSKRVRQIGRHGWEVVAETLYPRERRELLDSMWRWM